MRHKRKAKTKKQQVFDKCERLWKEIARLLAGNKSELSGISDEVLQVHHVNGKSTNMLRFNIKNGIVLTHKEHMYGIHNHDPSISYEYHERIREYIKQREGDNIFTILESQKNYLKADIYEIKLALENELKRLKQD